MTGSRRSYLVLSVVIGGALAGCSLRGMKRAYEASELVHEQIALNGVATLALDALVGEIIIRSGASGEIRVDYTKTVYAKSEADAAADLSRLEVKIEQDGEQVRIYTVDNTPRRHLHANKVDFVITVPDTINLIVEQDVGNIRVEDIHVPDTLRLASNVGELRVIDVQAPGSMKLSTDIGEIKFEGTLAGDASISTKVGAIRMELSPDAALRVDAQTQVGNISVSDFATSDVQKERQIVSARWRGTLGQGSELPALSLRAETGDIRIRAG